MDPILHLSLPVSDLNAARAFYVDALGCTPGQALPGGMDVWFYGMQLTLQLRPDEVVPNDRQGVRHFGVSLAPDDLQQLLTRLESFPVQWIKRVAPGDAEAVRGKTSVKIADPSGNVIELKSYDDAVAALEVP